MIGSFRNFAKTKFAGILVVIMIIPFVFWGMGSMFSGGNTNNLAKIDKTNISTNDFIDYLNNTGISQKVVKDNLDNNIIEELLSRLISTTLLDLEIEDFQILISEKTLLKKIKKNKDFINENGEFERTKYEKFLLEKNVTAPTYEQGIKYKELQKNLFDLIGAGTTTPVFLATKLYKNEKRKINLEYINLQNFYLSQKKISDQDLLDFVNENEAQLKIQYVDFEYAKINPQNLVGSEEFNQIFFDKIDQIEIDISNGVNFNSIVKELNLKSKIIKNFRFSENNDVIENKIFQVKDVKFDIIETDNNFILYYINKIEDRKPNLSDPETRKEIFELVTQKNKFDYNRNLLEKISKKEFTETDFTAYGKENIKTATLNSINDDNKFDIRSVELLYSMPMNSFNLINDKNNDIYLTKIKSYDDKIVDQNSDEFKLYLNKQNSKSKSNILKSYDLLLKDKYNVITNQKTIDRVKNFFQ